MWPVVDLERQYNAASLVTIQSFSYTKLKTNDTCVVTHKLSNVVGTEQKFLPVHVKVVPQ